ncbi:MAG: hypothetical protein AB7V45_12955, partial [Candidatus Krumholzibacteriia bacterium]
SGELPASRHCQQVFPSVPSLEERIVHQTGDNARPLFMPRSIGAGTGPRWQNYVLEKGEGLVSLWRSRGEADSSVLLVLGKGFDPRTCLGAQTLLERAGIPKCDAIAIELDEGASSPSKAHSELVKANWAALERLIDGKGVLSTRKLKMWSEDGRRIGSRSAAGLFGSLEDFAAYTDVVIDISALPRAVFFPLIAKVLYLLDHGSVAPGRKKPNLHVLVAEDTILDCRIRDEGIDEAASYVHPFGGRLEMEATADHPRVWMPVLGEGQGTQLNRIYDLVMPDEIAPILPSPSVNPRRSDDLLLEYRELLFDRLRVEPSNFIFASEQNPFEVYRQIRRVIVHYREALEPLGGCKAVLSALSTKLLSVGVLLVVYELKEAKIDVGIAHVECQGYTLRAEDGSGNGDAGSELFDLWLWGECYES